jgi:UDP-perosamine 4-acetyltransferase
MGAGGHAKVVIDGLRHCGWTVIGCTDADPAPRHCADVPVIGSDEILARVRAEGVGHAFCALGPNQVREKLAGRLRELEFSLPSFAGQGAILSSTVRVGAGVAIMPGAVINIDTRIGDLAIVNTNANIDHDGDLGTAAHVGPGASLAGNVTVGERAFIATGSAVIPGRTIGADTVVGAGSVVVRDLPAGVVAYGNPARVRRSG